MYLATKRFQLVEVKIPANLGANGRIPFDPQPQLQSVTGDKTVVTRAMETYSNQNLVGSPLTSGVLLATPADIINGLLTLVVSGTESIKQVPLADLTRVFADPANYVPYVWQPFCLYDIDTIDWTKSYIEVINAPAAGPPQRCYMFGVHYYYHTDLGEIK